MQYRLETASVAVVIFLEARLIFLHVHKTGGNSISRVLLPYSDDKMTLRKHQDGVNRFGITGKMTMRKHACLADYKKNLGRHRLSKYKVAISVRDPLDRAISMYFSPHRWMSEREGSWYQEAPYWDFLRFERVISKMASISDFLQISGKLHPPDHIIRFENIADDLKKLADEYDIPFNPAELPHVNKSAAAVDMHNRLRTDPKVQEMVKIRFAIDYVLLDSFAVG